MPQDCARIAAIALFILTFGPSAESRASPDASDLCLDAAARAARQSGVPRDVLLAITMVETGRGSRPWPWTVNLGGEGHWLDSADAAETLVAKALEEGLTNIDLGCFQLNYRWHADAFASVADMLNPDANALYAAEFLAQHHAQTGEWASAAAAYHSATPEHAERYRARFQSAWSALAGDGGAPEFSASLAIRPNRFPLLLAGQSGRGGSLVPDTVAGQRLIGDH
ncbi:lytic transglycosylase domain-containing protein [Tabrizicola piscis]|uniref:Lytic transglycosylase domain-containing protein n=2 Tax=Tabrizicola piscis TaxID=2494374 RepID=A0A3S8UCK1_9RHOB|nr:lytic transglycosylase domain-containing protein [Tabrizicola piscis]